MFIRIKRVHIQRCQRKKKRQHQLFIIDKQYQFVSVFTNILIFLLKLDLRSIYNRIIIDQIHQIILIFNILIKKSSTNMFKLQAIISQAAIYQFSKFNFKKILTMKLNIIIDRDISKIFNSSIFSKNRLYLVLLNQQLNFQQQFNEFNVLIIYCLVMIKQMQVQEGVKQIYGNSMKRVVDIKSYWYLFTPYENIKTKEISYFKILKTSSSYHLSQQVYNKCLTQFNGFIHKVEIILLQRSFQSTFYLLKSNSNIITLKSLLDLRLECRQRVQPQQILRIIQFLAILYKKYKLNIFNINLNTVGLTQAGIVLLSDYHHYFLKKEESLNISFKDSLFSILINIIAFSNNSSLNLMNQELYILTLEYYDLNFANFVSNIINMNPLDPEKVLELVSQIQIQLQKVTTISDPSFLESNDVSDTKVEHGSFIGKQSLVKSNSSSYLNQSRKISNSSTQVEQLSPNKNSKMSKNKTIIVWIIALITFLAIIGIALMISLNFFTRPILCSEGQYLTPQNKCAFCDQRCERCLNSESNQCLSCKGAMYLVIKTSDDKAGVCMEQCYGFYVLQRHVCIENL